MTLQAPSSWRGPSARQADEPSGASRTKRVGLLARVGREVADHPAETVAIIAMGVAAARLLSRKESEMSLPAGRGRRRPSRLAPIGLMAAICMMMIAGCGIIPRPVIQVAPDPETFGRAYGENLVAAGEAIAREHCVSCHGAPGGHGRAGAPPLTTLVARRGSQHLADDLVAGLAVVHDNMPIFDFNVTAEIALIAYLEAISAPDDGKT